MTIKMETMSELPDIKAEVLPDEFGLNGAGGHNVTSAEANVPASNGPDANCQWVSSTPLSLSCDIASFRAPFLSGRLYGVHTSRRPYNGLLTDCLHCSWASSQNNLTPP